MNCGWGGCGLVFRMTQGSRGKWKEQVIRHFKGGRDGVSPQGPVVFDVAGNLHGTTAIGGGGPCQWYGTGCGTVFELTPNQNGKWTEQVLHRFRGGAGGSHPVDALVFDATGNMYGAANGRADGDNGLIYEVIP